MFPDIGKAMESAESIDKSMQEIAARLSGIEKLLTAMHEDECGWESSDGTSAADAHVEATVVGDSDS